MKSVAGRLAARPLAARLYFRTRRASHFLQAKAVLAVLAMLRRLPPQRALDFIDRAARRIGPKTGRHRLALENLRRAFPEKPEAEIAAIASDMWGNMGRLAAEYIFLEELFDFDPQAAAPGRVEVGGAEIFEELRDRRGPFVFFTAHMGNFELLPICAATFGLDVTALFRPPNNPFIAAEVQARRQTRMGRLVPSKAGAAWELARVLDRGGSVGLLVDQKFRKKGVASTFFGQEVRTNPLLAKLVRHYDCEVYPARCIRLPGGRFRLDLFPRLELPRDGEGKLDAQATAQLLNDTVETWVREHPGQWMWFHDRWDRRRRKRRSPAPVKPRRRGR